MVFGSGGTCIIIAEICENDILLIFSVMSASWMQTKIIVHLVRIYEMDGLKEKTKITHKLP